MALVQQTSHLLLSEGTTLALAPLAQSLADPLFFFCFFSGIVFCDLDPVLVIRLGFPLVRSATFSPPSLHATQCNFPFRMKQSCA